MPEPECEFKKECEKAFETFPFDEACCPDPLEVCVYRKFAILVRKKTPNSPQFKKQYAKLSDVKKVLESLPVKNDDFVRDVMDEIEVVGRTE